MKNSIQLDPTNPITILRKRYGIATRRELAVRAKLSPQAIANFEHGVNLAISDDAAKKVGAVFGIPGSQVQTMYLNWRAGEDAQTDPTAVVMTYHRDYPECAQYFEAEVSALLLDLFHAADEAEPDPLPALSQKYGFEKTDLHKILFEDHGEIVARKPESHAITWISPLAPKNPMLSRQLLQHFTPARFFTMQARYMQYFRAIVYLEDHLRRGTFSLTAFAEYCDRSEEEISLTLQMMEDSSGKNYLVYSPKEDTWQWADGMAPDTDISQDLVIAFWEKLEHPLSFSFSEMLSTVMPPNEEILTPAAPAEVVANGQDSQPLKTINDRLGNIVAQLGNIYQRDGEQISLEENVFQELVLIRKALEKIQEEIVKYREYGSQLMDFFERQDGLFAGLLGMLEAVREDRKHSLIPKPLAEEKGKGNGREPPKHVDSFMEIK